MKRIIKIFNRIFLIFPCAIAMICAILYFFNFTDKLIKDFDTTHFMLPLISNRMACIAFTIILLFGGIIISAFINSITKKKENTLFRLIIIGLSIFLLSVSLRLALINYFKDEIIPFSDFLNSWNIAHNMDSSLFDYYSLFPAYLNFSRYEHAVIQFLGDNYIYVIVINSILSGFTAVLIFFISDLFLGRSNVGKSVLAGIIYAIFPSDIFYVCVGTPEYITIFFDTLAIAIISYCSRCNVGTLKKIVFHLIAGAALGIANSYKSFSSVIVIAYVMILFVKFFIEYVPKKGIKKFVMCIVLCCILLVGFKASSISILNQTQREYNLALKNETAVPHFILVGLNTEGEGQIHLGNMSRKYYEYYLDHGQNYKEAKEYAYRLLLDDWKKNPKKIIPLFAKKMIWAWQDDSIPFFYFTYCMGIDNLFFNEYMPGILQCFYIILIISIVIFQIKQSKKDIVLYVEFYDLIIFGYFCLMTLSEAQSRYKCLIMPYICVLSSYGLFEIQMFFRQFINEENRVGNK